MLPLLANTRFPPVTYPEFLVKTPLIAPFLMYVFIALGLVRRLVCAAAWYATRPATCGHAMLVPDSDR